MKNIPAERFMLTQNYYKNEQKEDVFEFAVEDPEETLFWTIRLGSRVEVLEPWDLKAKVIKLAEDVLGNYK
jgi:predicted DNA-binding transcriptional regulator YafY